MTSIRTPFHLKKAHQLYQGTEWPLIEFPPPDPRKTGFLTTNVEFFTTPQASFPPPGPARPAKRVPLERLGAHKGKRRRQVRRTCGENWLKRSGDKHAASDSVGEEILIFSGILMPLRVIGRHFYVGATRVQVHSEKVCGSPG